MHANSHRAALAAGALVAAAFVALSSSPARGADGTALTTAQKDALRSDIAACDKLPKTKQQPCVDRARQDYARMDPSLSPAQKAALEREGAKYKSAVAACQKRPASERTTCISEAGEDYRLAGLK